MTSSSVAELVRGDPWLQPHAAAIERRGQRVGEFLQHVNGDLAGWASGHQYFGLHREADRWIFREWAPGAVAIYLTGDFCNWQQCSEFALNRLPGRSVWEIQLPAEALHHGDLYRLILLWEGGCGERIPAYAKRVVQDADSKIFTAQVWLPSESFVAPAPVFRRDPKPPLIYEAHVGIASAEGKVASYAEFRQQVLPRIIAGGYNTLQLMAVQEHPYYGSCGYQVSSFFAPSSRFGTPDELRELIAAAHGAGVAVIMDLVHSHAARNVNEGLSCFDGTGFQYFHDGSRGFHPAWDSRCFDYGKTEVVAFLLSNCRYWLEEFGFDGFRFDGVTSMLYRDHGLGAGGFSYDDYFGDNVDEDAVRYLTLANQLIHQLRPDALTVAEDVSGMPGLAAPIAHGGIGFDYRLAMGLPDYWIRLTKDTRDEDWHLGQLWHELTNHRQDERTIAYAESHDQALVGDKTLIFRLMDAQIYDHMRIDAEDLIVDRGMALHKMIRLITIMAGGDGYLNFMGNEFGHPEWIDFPRQGNNWSYHYARRQWHLCDDPELRYGLLAAFDRAMIELVTKGLVLAAPAAVLLHEHHEDKVLAFARAGMLVVLNFHPTQSYVDYGIACPAGAYELVLETDAPEFGGHGRLQKPQCFFSREPDGRPRISLYLPARTGLVLAPKSADGPLPRACQ